MSVSGQMELGAQIHGDAAPALEHVRVRGALRDAAALVVVMEARSAGHVVVGLRAAPQALAMAALAPVRACVLAAVRAN